MKHQGTDMALTRAQVLEVLEHLDGTPKLIANLIYGSGMRLRECCRLRVKDLDFGQLKIAVHDGKGPKHCVTVMPAKLVTPLTAHLERVREQHERDLKTGAVFVKLPTAQSRMDPGTASRWPWQWVFPARWMSVDQESGRERRDHLHESIVQKAIKEAARATGLNKPASSHSLRRSYVRHLRNDGYKVLDLSLRP